MKKAIVYILQLLKRIWLLLRKNRVPMSSYILDTRYILNCNVGRYCYIGGKTALVNVDIGNYSSIAYGVHIGGMEHKYTEVSTSTHLNDFCEDKKRTKIGHDVWIGAYCIIKQGITIGNGSIIGAGSVVLKDVPENSIYVGIPAKLLKQRFSDDIWRKI